MSHSDAQSNALIQLERGLRAQQKGDSQLAEKHLVESLRISSSIEDNPGKIIAFVNLARLNRLIGKPEAATTYIDQALQLAHNLPGLMMETTYEKAMIALAQNRCEEALKWAMHSLSSESVESKGRRLNLIARIHRASGNSIEAFSFALKALEDNRNNGQADEESNSLRLLGLLERESGRFIEAGKFLQIALDIDKRLGKSAKIALDLEEFAALYGDQGDLNGTLEYLERAYSVHVSGTRLQRAASIQYKMADIFRRTGNMAQAEKAVQTAKQLMLMKSSSQDNSSESANPSSKP